MKKKEKEEGKKVGEEKERNRKGERKMKNKNREIRSSLQRARRRGREEE